MPGPLVTNGRLSRLRVRAGLSQRDAAHAAGLSHGHYLNLEHGRYVLRGPHMRTIERIALAFGCSVEEVGRALRPRKSRSDKAPRAA